MASSLESDLDSDKAARQWAAEVLDVAENASFADAKRAYFKKTREQDFLPSLELRRAIAVFSGDSSAAAPEEEQRAGAEARRRGEVADFADQFFTLAEADRREHWRRLAAKCQSAPSLSAWLRSLEPGLDVKRPGVAADKSVRGKLTRHLLHAFPLPPPERVSARQSFIRDIEEFTAKVHQNAWQKAARSLRNKQPTIAALDERLVQQLADLHSRLKRKTKLRNRRQRKAKSSAGGASWTWIVPIVIFSGILSSLQSHNNSNSPPPYAYNPQSYDSSWSHEFSPAPIVPRAEKASESIDSTIHKLAALFPPVDDLVDPANFDVALDPRSPNFICFTPRPQSKYADPAGPQQGKRIDINNMVFLLIGGTSDQFGELKERAKRNVHPAQQAPPEQHKGP